MPYANNKGPDQPVHPCSLISTFIVPYLDSIMPPVFISEITSLQLTSKAVQADLCPTWSQNSADRFSRGMAHMYLSVVLQ